MSTPARFRIDGWECFFHYPDNPAFTLLLPDFSLEFERIIGIYGLNGSGKSTFGKLIGGVLAPSSGKLTVELCEAASTARRRAQFKYLPQQPEELFLGLKIEEITRRFEDDKSVLDFMRHLEYFVLPYTSIRTAYGYELSAGQLRKVALAFGLSYSCDGIILDEPTQGLSPQICRRFEQLVATGKTDKALVLISHDFRLLARICTSLIVFEEGRAVFSGTVGQLMLAESLNDRLGLAKFRLLSKNVSPLGSEVYESS